MTGGSKLFRRKFTQALTKPRTSCPPTMRARVRGVPRAPLAPAISTFMTVLSFLRCKFWGEAADFLAMLLLKVPPLLSPVKPFSRDEARENGNRERPG